jgi:hypothetical protein
MRIRLPASLRALLATLQVVMIGAWSPVMMARMAAHQDADPMPGMHHPADAHHGGNPLECCALCPLTCAAPVGIASAPVPLPFPPAVARISARAERTTPPRSLQERRLPFPVGPPTLRSV